MNVLLGGMIKPASATSMISCIVLGAKRKARLIDPWFNWSCTTSKGLSPRKKEILLSLLVSLIWKSSLVIKLKNHPWVKDSNQLDIEFKDIWLSYLKDITGFIVYTGNKLTLYSPETIKQNFEPVRVVQNQLNIVKKGEI